MSVNLYFYLDSMTNSVAVTFLTEVKNKNAYILYNIIRQRIYQCVISFIKEQRKPVYEKFYVDCVLIFFA